MSDSNNKASDAIDHRLLELWVDFYFDIEASNMKAYWKHISRKDTEGLRRISRGKNLLKFFTHLFERPVSYLSSYTDEQINHALWYLIGASGQWMEMTSNGNLPWEDKKRLIYAIYTVYEQLFEPRCSATLTHLDNEEKNPLNSVCYIWWDSIELPYNQPQINEAAIDVMERTLKLKNIACLEGALHGLGHYQRANKERVHAIIDQFLADNPDLHDDLRHYALNARDGAVQ